MSATARAAIYAARNRQVWGKEATARYCQEAGIPLSLFNLACRLEGAKE